MFPTAANPRAPINPTPKALRTPAIGCARISRTLERAKPVHNAPTGSPASSLRSPEALRPAVAGSLLFSVNRSARALSGFSLYQRRDAPRVPLTPKAPLTARAV